MRFFRPRTPQEVERARLREFRGFVLVLLLVIAVNSCTIDNKLEAITRAAGIPYATIGGAR